MQEERYKSFGEFYPFYLSEHSNKISRRLHFTGTSIALGLLIAAAITQTWWLIALALVQGYAFAWVGHYFFERNKPASRKWILVLGLLLLAGGGATLAWFAMTGNESATAKRVC